MSGPRATEPVWHTFLLHPDVDVEAAKEAYETQGWQRDGNGTRCAINGVEYRLLGMKRLGRIIEKDWRRDPKQPYDVPPGWDGPSMVRHGTASHVDPSTDGPSAVRAVRRSVTRPDL